MCYKSLFEFSRFLLKFQEITKRVIVKPMFIIITIGLKTSSKKHVITVMIYFSVKEWFVLRTESRTKEYIYLNISKICRNTKDLRNRRCSLCFFLLSSFLSLLLVIAIFCNFWRVFIGASQRPIRSKLLFLETG